jgi:hypothetical protein
VTYFILGTGRSLISWQPVVYGQQGFLGIIEDQTIGRRHLPAHRIAAEDHPWVKPRGFAERLVKLSGVDR